MDKNSESKEKNAERWGKICGKKRLKSERKKAGKTMAMEEKRERKERK